MLGKKNPPQKISTLSKSLPHSHSLPGLLPWYNHAGWLRVKHEVTYSWAPFNSLASVNGPVLLLFTGALDASADTRVDCYHHFVAVIRTHYWPQGMFPHGKAGSYSLIPTPKQYQKCVKRKSKFRNNDIGPSRHLLLFILFFLL